MFCPKCSQPQASETVRFCSRCGLELDVVKALINGEEVTSSLEAVAARRKKDVTKGALLMFVFALSVAALTVDMPRSHSARIMLLIVAWLLLTLFINLGPLISYFFGQEKLTSINSYLSKLRPSELMSGLRKTKEADALPPAQSTFIDVSTNQAVNTREVVNVPSVTEQTTNLLTRQ